ncbi:MAG: aminopeptidase P family protein [Candidatus Rokubacteria bacterium]|nr:aminopeptidase P family protein [Candidatus Rokubacteria bacterium]
MQMRGHDRLGFSLAEYRRRHDTVMQGMGKLGIDALLVRSPENICYLTGYETPGYYKYHGLLLSQEEPVLVLRRFEEANVWEFSWLTRTVPVEDHEHPVRVTARTLERMRLADTRIGVEKAGWFFSVEEYEALKSALPKATFVDASAVVERARLVKSDEEIAMMRRAARIADVATQAGIDAVQAGRTEEEIAAEVHRVAIQNGSEFMGLPPFVLSGERTCLPHGTWRGRTVEPGDHVYFEVSAAKFRYSAAIMRCVSLGEPSVRVRALADAVIGGLEAGMAAIKPGVAAEAVDAACRGVIEKAGFGEYFTHRTGYSIGVNFPPDWGEGQILSLRRGEPTPLEANMTFHMVPLCLIYRELGVGFSATVRVTEAGCEELTSLPRKLIVK